MWQQSEHRKRRSSSPLYFPKKVHVSEEKVAQELENLRIGSAESKDVSQPNFLADGNKRLRTFQEIEDSIEIDDKVEVEKGTVELAPELIQELRRLNRKILIPNYSPKKPISMCKEVMLWQPPSGVAAKILDVVNQVQTSSRRKSDNELKMEKTDMELDMDDDFDIDASSSSEIASSSNITNFCGDFCSIDTLGTKNPVFLHTVNNNAEFNNYDENSMEL